MDERDSDPTLVGFQAGQKVFARYTLQRLLGRGGMGVVWLAHDDTLDQEVALKFLPEVVARDEEAINDLKRETRRALRLTHPRIVRIYDFVEDAHGAGITMEYVDGRTLTSLKLEQPARCFEVSTLRPWVAQLCEALHYAHTEAQVAHRDLKPANLMITRRGEVKVADFGISATLADTATRASKVVGSSGTPLYMSPQQMLGEKPAATDDIYALGATLYELLTGKPPFYLGNVLLQAQNKVPPSLAVRRTELEVRGTEAIPAAWEETVAACLAKDPAQRPQSVQEIAQRLLGGPVGGGAGRPPSGEVEATVRIPRGEEPGRGESAGENMATPVDATVRIEAVPPPLPREEGAAVAGPAPHEPDAAPPALGAALPPPLPPRQAKSRGWPRVVGLVCLMALCGWALLSRCGLARQHQAELANQEIAAEQQAMDWVSALPLTASAADIAKLEGKLEVYLATAPEGWAELVKQAFAERKTAIEHYRAQQVPAPTEPVKPVAGQPWTVPDLNLTMVALPAGTFTMGNATAEQEDERPVRSVTLTQPFWLGATEVTQAQWKSLMENDPAGFPGDDRPVEQISWDDAQAFCQKLTERERAAGRLPDGYAYALPTEAQWEYACRAGGAGEGTEAPAGHAWSSENSEAQTHAVAQHPANAWGLYDMHGNVWEFCRDWYGSYPEGSVSDPTGPESGEYRVVRGGSWNQPGVSCTATFRGAHETGTSSDIGFRLALVATGE